MTDWESLYRQARAIPCGNTWDTLSGDERQRLCRDCNRQVHNLAALTPEAFEALQAENPDRLCVVLEPAPMRFWPIFARPFAAMLTLMLLCQTAGAQETQPVLQRCEDYLYTPRMWPPDETCRDENGKPVALQPWLKEAHQKENRQWEEEKTPASPDR